MGNRRNKRKLGDLDRTLPSQVKVELRESDQGSYYNDLCDDDIQSTVTLGDCDSQMENGILIEEEVEKVISASERKLLVFPPTDYEEEADHLDGKDQEEVVAEGSRVFDLSLLSAALQAAAKCSTCNSGKLTLAEKPHSRKGWASTFYFSCDVCDEKTSFHSSRYIRDDKTKPAVINR